MHGVPGGTPAARELGLAFAELFVQVLGRRRGRVWRSWFSPERRLLSVVGLEGAAKGRSGGSSCCRLVFFFITMRGMVGVVVISAVV